MDVILGMGEVGATIFELLSTRGHRCMGIDVDSSKNKNVDEAPSNIDALHVCTPGDVPDFQDTVLKAVELYKPTYIMIHSTVRPGTADAIQEKITAHIISSPARGVHRRFLKDMQRYSKFVASARPITKDIRDDIEDKFKKVRWMSDTKTLEFAKILTDTTYYGWLINYAQITKMICDENGIDYDEMWSFADEIQEYLGNRPKMYPGIIGGHCVIPNLALTDCADIQIIGKINEMFEKHTKDTANNTADTQK